MILLDIKSKESLLIKSVFLFLFFTFDYHDIHAVETKQNINCVLLRVFPNSRERGQKVTKGNGVWDYVMTDITSMGLLLEEDLFWKCSVSSTTNRNADSSNSVEYFTTQLHLLPMDKSDNFHLCQCYKHPFSFR